MRLAALSSMVLLGCSPGTDVVARLVDGGAESASTDETKKPSSPAEGSVCEAANTLTVLTKSFEVHRFDLAKKTVIGTSDIDKCLPSGPIAVNASGDLWIATRGAGLSVGDLAGNCKALPVKLTPTALAVVWHPKRRRELLYAIESDVLYMIDPSAPAVPALVGTLSPPIDGLRGLAGSSEGRLFAFGGSTVVSISTINIDDATVDPTLITKTPNGLSFAGGVPIADGFELVFGPQAFTFGATSQGAPIPDMALFAEDPGIISVAASPCVSTKK